MIRIRPKLLSSQNKTEFSTKIVILESIVALLFVLSASSLAIVANQFFRQQDVEMPPQATITKSTHLMSLEVAFPNLSFDVMVHLTHPGDGTNRLFVALLPGQIYAFDNEEEVDSTDLFLDIRERVKRGGSEGLLGLAFDPDFKENGYFYVYYSADQPRRSVVSRFSVSADNPNKADPTSELIILEVSQPFGSHNGGSLGFGPDNYLYIALGDGGESIEQFAEINRRGWLKVGGTPQNRTNLLGSILRIDVSNASSDEKYAIPSDNPFVNEEGIRPEIWAYGLRNPWRFSFDRLTGQLWVGDVGQSEFEEVDLIIRGGNYGWNVMEGFHCFPESVLDCRQSEFELPIFEYLHREGDVCAITGGYVYRGNTHEFLVGTYVFGDFCLGRIWALHFEEFLVTEVVNLVESGPIIPAFGEDRDGELYILSFDGFIYHLKALPKAS